MFYRIPDGKGRAIPQVGTGIIFDGESSQARSAPPSLGEHTDEVLSELLGLNEEQLHNLQAQNIIWRKRT